MYNTMNLLMNMAVCTLLPPKTQAYMRCAGVGGGCAFEEVVSLRRLPYYFELAADFTSEEGRAPPAVDESSPPVGNGDDEQYQSNYLRHSPVGPRVPNADGADIGDLYLDVSLVYREAPQEEGQNTRQHSDDPFWTEMIEFPSTIITFNEDYGKARGGGGGAADDVDNTIPKDFMAACRTTSVSIRGCSSKKSISDGFMSMSPNLQSINLDSLTSVTSIGGSFMYSCTCLKTINLTPFKNVTIVGNYFMHGCQSLEHIDISPLSNLISIKNSFLSGCKGLKSIDLDPVNSVKEIGNYFLSCCYSLTEVDLFPLAQLQSIGDAFLYACHGITSINLAPLHGVPSLGSSFMAHCRSLRHLDTSPLVGLDTDEEGEGILHNFLTFCSSLESVNLTGFTHQKKIGGNFLYCCALLTDIDLSPLSSVALIQDNFMYGCTSLSPNIDLTPLSNVVGGMNFMNE